MTADEIIELLQLERHPEGGHFRRTWADGPADGSRGSGSAIYFLVTGSTRRHRIDATEIWHHYAGDPVELVIGEDAAAVLGPDLAAGQWPQIVVPADTWQHATCLGDWSLVGCTASPEFTFDGFEVDEGSAPD